MLWLYDQQMDSLPKNPLHSVSYFVIPFMTGGSVRLTQAFVVFAYTFSIES